MSTVIGLAYLAVLVVGVLDAGRRPYDQWRAAGRDKNFWLVALFFFGPLFILPYLLAVRPRLQAAAILARPESATKPTSPDSKDR